MLSSLEAGYRDDNPMPGDKPSILQQCELKPHVMVDEQEAVTRLDHWGLPPAAKPALDCLYPNFFCYAWKAKKFWLSHYSWVSVT